MTTFMAGGNKREGYLAIPKDGEGEGILVLHAWWGLTDFFKYNGEAASLAWERTLEFLGNHAG